MGSGCTMHGEKRNAYGLLVGKPGGKSPLGRPNCRILDGVVWTGIIWLRLGTSGGLL
jgi:hypothetical protein